MLFVQEVIMAVVAQDNRIHSTVYHKLDSRVNDIIRRHKKSDIVNIYDIDTLMMFRVEAAHIQFDMMENHRPYILFHGRTEGVYLPASSGLLFPNACDHLDLRKDHPVEATLHYVLSDVEISVLAQNGLYHGDYSCQGRIIGSLLEIPCKTDYYAVINTPITFIEIQDRLSLQTSTKRTGYKSLVSAFLPYAAQKHNLEEYPVLVQAEKADNSHSEIRKRGLYDSKAVGFDVGTHGRTMKDGASFVEVAQDRIQARLQEQMGKSNVLGLRVDKTSQQITKDVAMIKEQVDKTKKQTLFNLEGNANKVDVATLDARLNDMANRMVYAGAQEIPVKTDPIEVSSLVEKKPDDQNDVVMTAPLTNVTDDVNTINAKNRAQNVSEKLSQLDEDMHHKVFDAEDTAKSVVEKTLSRKEKLQQRAAQRRQIQQRALEAAEDEAKKGMTQRESDVRDIIVNPKTGEKKETNRAKMDRHMQADILANDIDIDELIETLGK